MCARTPPLFIFTPATVSWGSPGHMERLRGGVWPYSPGEGLRRQMADSISRPMWLSEPWDNFSLRRCQTKQRCSLPARLWHDCRFKSKRNVALKPPSSSVISTSSNFSLWHARVFKNVHWSITYVQGSARSEVYGSISCDKCTYTVWPTSCATHPHAGELGKPEC